jgi:hypothetical protein
MAEAAAGEAGEEITADAAVPDADAAADAREPAAARKPVGERPASGARPAKKPKADPLDADPVIRAAKTALQNAFMRNVHAPSPKNQKALDQAQQADTAARDHAALAAWRARRTLKSHSPASATAAPSCPCPPAESIVLSADGVGIV